jgi:hypothetical protein
MVGPARPRYIEHASWPHHFPFAEVASMKRTLLASVWIMVLAAAALHAQDTPDLAQIWREPVEVKDFTQPRTLREALAHLDDIFAARKINLSLMMDSAAFREPGAEVSEIGDVQVMLPNLPRRLPLAVLLQRLVAQLPVPASYLLRDGGIVILPAARATPAALLRAPVLARFEKRPLRQALEELSAHTGATILLDPRVNEKAQAPVTATLKNTITLEAAVRLLAEMADLRAVVENDILFVTQRVRPAERPAEGVRLEFRGRRLDEALRELAEATGTTVVIDPDIQKRISAAGAPLGSGVPREAGVAAEEEQLEPTQSFRVTATFRGDVTPESAARILTTMTGLYVNSIGGALYVNEFGPGVQ